MKQLVEFPLQDGSSIVVEVDEPETQGIVQASRAGEIVERAEVTFQEALGRVKPAAEDAISQFRGLVDPPDEVTVTFGLNFTAQAGAVIASVGTEANFSMTLTWKRKDAQVGGA